MEGTSREKLWAALQCLEHPEKHTVDPHELLSLAFNEESGVMCTTRSCLPADPKSDDIVLVFAILCLNAD